MQKVIDYKLVAKGSVHRLEEEVKNEMQNGWVPSGVVVSFHERLVQAMVKFEEA